MDHPVHEIKKLDLESINQTLRAIKNNFRSEDVRPWCYAARQDISGGGMLINPNDEPYTEVPIIDADGVASQQSHGVTATESGFYFNLAGEYELDMMIYARRYSGSASVYFNYGVSDKPNPANSSELLTPLFGRWTNANDEDYDPVILHAPIKVQAETQVYFVMRADGTPSAGIAIELRYSSCWAKMIRRLI